MLPDSERTRIPIGSYKFQIIKEPDARRKTGQSGKQFTAILFILKATNESGETFEHVESILAFEDKYDDLLLALGAEEVSGRLSGKTINPVGMMFQAEIVHEKDEKDPTKTWAKMASIKPVEDDDVQPKEKDRFEDPEESLPVKSPVEVEDDDEVPF